MNSATSVTIDKPVTQALQLCAAVLSHPNTSNPVEALNQLSHSLQSITQTFQTAAVEQQAEVEKVIQRQLVPIILEHATSVGIDINSMPRIKTMTLAQTYAYIGREFPDLVPKLKQRFPKLTLIIND